MRLAAAVLACLVFSTDLFAAPRRRAVKINSARGPSCTDVRGLPGVYISTDGGKTFSGNADPAQLTTSWGFLALPGAPHVIAVGSRIYDSRDHGCLWTLRHTVTETIHHPLQAVAGEGERAFVWTEELAVRYDGGVVTPLILPEQIGGIGSDPGNGDHVRVIGLTSTALYDSFDGGVTWTRISQPRGGFITAAAFDPTDPNRAVIGTVTEGAIYTTDGGQRWQGAAGVGRTVCDVAFSEKTPNVVWMTARVGTNLIFRSQNGGQTFAAVAADTGFEKGVCVQIVPNPQCVTRDPSLRSG